jgi:hypothetical protein
LRFRFRGSIEVNKIGGESFSVAIIVQQFLEKTNQRVEPMHSSSSMANTCSVRFEDDQQIFLKLNRST